MNEIIQVIKEEYCLVQVGIFFIFPLDPAMIRFDDQLHLLVIPDDLYKTIRKCYFDKEPVTLLDKLNLKHLTNFLMKQAERGLLQGIQIDYADPRLFEIIAAFGEKNDNCSESSQGTV